VIFQILNVHLGFTGKHLISHKNSHFFINRIVELGTSHGIRPGDFFGPVSAAHCLKEAIQTAVEANQIPEILRIYISQDAISRISIRLFPFSYLYLL
jgi:hypothetical protein